MCGKQVSSWGCWKEIIPNLESENPVGAPGGYISPLLFRGHQCASWKLESTLERNGKDLPSFDDYANQLKLVKLAFESYLGSSWPSVFTASEAPAPPQDYEFMVYLRHHGYPTPLLDWTRSPYIASFFAFRYPSPEPCVAIFSFREYAGEGKSGCTSNPTIVGCGPTIRTHKRHYAQQAEYTYCRKKANERWVYAAHEDALKATGGNQDILRKYLLPAPIRRDALADLDSMNINAYTLYGTEESLAEMLANREYGYET